MPANNLVIYIDTAAKLKQYLPLLSESSEIALDIEFDREHYTYGNTLCLIQIFAVQQCFIVDPMKGIPLGELFRFFENPAITKVMHAPGEDLQILHLNGCFPVNIFDTERAARLLNYESFSLSALVKELTGNILNKSAQKTDWNKRPLSQQQILYAGNDVVWLPEIRDSLCKQAKEKGVHTWLEQENKAWDLYRAENRPEGVYYHKDDIKKYSAYNLFILNELLRFRDEHAQKLNKPCYMIISRETIDLLLTNPDELNNWFQLKGVHQSLKHEQSRQAIKSLLKNAHEIAHNRNLSTGVAAKNKNHADKFKSRQEIKDEVERVFRPVKHEIARQYGEHTAAYILNEKTMTNLCTHNIKLSELPYQYRINLINEKAQALGINISAYC